MEIENGENLKKFNGEDPNPFLGLNETPVYFPI